MLKKLISNQKNNQMKTTKTCDLCGQNHWTKYCHHLTRCSYCGLVRSKSEFFNFTPSAHYGEKYFKGQDYLDYEVEGEAMTKNARSRLKTIKFYKKSGSLLDIGCAFGYFVHEAQCFGFEAEGWDVNHKTVKIAQINTGLPIYQGNDFSKSTLPKKYDVITLFDVIEHLQNPDKYLSKIYQSLKNNGVVVIETGDIDSWLAKFQKCQWRLICPAIHLFYFSQKTLIQMLIKHHFKIIKVQRVGFWRSIGQILYRTKQPKLVQRFLSRIQSFPIRLNTFDLLLVIAQK